MAKNFWLMKSEPEVFSIDDLEKAGKTLWDGVRNYQARNFMTQKFQIGDQILFYHSNAKPPGVAGLARVASKAIPDPTAFDKKSKYYDPKSRIEKPIWFCVEISFLQKFERVIGLPELRQIPALKKMMLLQKGSRLSIQPVNKIEFETIKACTKIRANVEAECP